MDIHLIGHASLLIKTQDCRILIDPVFGQVHSEGWFEIFPRRAVVRDRLPSFDLLVISSAQPDHFDPATLMTLPTSVPVLIPPNRLLGACLQELGYTNLYPLRPLTEITFGSTTLLNTCLKNTTDRLGLVVADQSGVCWHPIDRPIQPSVFQQVQERFDTIDCLLMPWQSSLLPLPENHSGFLSTYNHFFDDIRLVQPRTVTIVANGMKPVYPISAPMHSRLPITRDRFYRDVETGVPDVTGAWLEPGDVLSIDQQSIEVCTDSCEFVQLIPTSGTVDERLSTEIYEMCDRNAEQYDRIKMSQVVHEEICVNLPKFITDYQHSLFQNHIRWQIIYQLTVFFSDHSETWHFDFTQSTVQAQAGAHSLASSFTWITASCYYSLIQQLKTTYYANWTTEYHHTQQIYLLTPTKIVTPDGFTQVGDPLLLKLPEHYNNLVTLQHSKYWKTQDDSFPVPQPNTLRSAHRPSTHRLTFDVP